MAFNSFSAMAGGSIATSRFVKLSTAADHAVLQAGANEEIVGVSSEAAQKAPIPGASVAAAESGDQLNVHPIGAIALVEVGSGNVTRGDRVKSDSSGKAVTAAATGTTVQWVGGLALASALEGELVPVLVHPYPFRPALT
jgi:hypothetical protein